MTTVVSWNIQAGLGVDGRVDLNRIARVITAFADADVICLQEIECPGHPASGVDQFAAIPDLFPRHTAIDGPCVQRGAGRGEYRFGNMVLSRLPVLSVFRHHLPWPAAPGVKHMPRQATEVTVATPAGPLRLVTTHLEYHSRAHRHAQVARLRELHAEVAAQERNPAQVHAQGPYASPVRPATSLVCGDFNMGADSDEYAAMLEPFDDGAPGLIDAWPALNPDRPHEPTCGVFDRVQWPAGPHCRDFFFVSEDLLPRLVSLPVDLETDASDHQPLALTLDDSG